MLVLSYFMTVCCHAFHVCHAGLSYFMMVCSYAMRVCSSIMMAYTYTMLAPSCTPYWLSWTALVATWLVWSYTMLVCCCILLTITNLCSEQSSCGPEYGGNLAGLHLHHSCTTNPHRQEAIGSRSLFQQIKNSFFYCGSVFSRITK
jgi:hypothetical protein